MSDKNASEPPIRVILADDHALVLEGLRGLLQNEPDIQIVTTVSDGESLMEAVRRLRPDLVIMDLQMPVKGGLSCLEEIRRENLPVKVLVLTAFGDGESLQLAWEREADGFALKTDPPRQTVAAIRNVAHGHVVFPRGALRARSQPDPQANPLSSLSEREREFLALVAQGLTNAQIAERLSVTEHTVKFHLQNIFQKLGAANRTEAARLYHQYSRRV
ncbi:MAG: response regulator transcription factor [Anaerolineae bacterium]